MGYRSDVAYAIQFNSADERATFRDVMMHKNDKHITSALDEAYDYKDKYIVCKDKNTKWYESYPAVGAHHKLMREAEELFQASYRFLAVGEDGQETFEEGGDDHETLCEMIYASHQLHADF